MRGEKVAGESLLHDALDSQKALMEPMAVVMPRAECPAALGIVRRYGYTVVGDDQSLVAALARGESIAVYMTELVSWRVCDIARQYSVREGAVQIQHAETLELSLIEVDPSVVKMVLVIPKECEEAIRARYPRLLDICGIVERLA